MSSNEKLEDMKRRSELQQQRDEPVPSENMSGHRTFSSDKESLESIGESADEPDDKKKKKQTGKAVTSGDVSESSSSNSQPKMEPDNEQGHGDMGSTTEDAAGPSQGAEMVFAADGRHLGPGDGVTGTEPMEPNEGLGAAGDQGSAVDQSGEVNSASDTSSEKLVPEAASPTPHTSTEKHIPETNSNGSENNVPMATIHIGGECQLLETGNDPTFEKADISCSQSSAAFPDEATCPKPHSNVEQINDVIGKDDVVGINADDNLVHAEMVEENEQGEPRETDVCAAGSGEASSDRGPLPPYSRHDPLHQTGPNPDNAASTSVEDSVHISQADGVDDSQRGRDSDTKKRKRTTHKENTDSSAVPDRKRHLSEEAGDGNTSPTKKSGSSTKGKPKKQGKRNADRQKERDKRSVKSSGNAGAGIPEDTGEQTVDEKPSFAQPTSSSAAKAKSSGKTGTSGTKTQKNLDNSRIQSDPHSGSDNMKVGTSSATEQKKQCDAPAKPSDTSGAADKSITQGPHQGGPSGATTRSQAKGKKGGPGQSKDASTKTSKTAPAEDTNVDVTFKAVLSELFAECVKDHTKSDVSIFFDDESLAHLSMRRLRRIEPGRPIFEITLPLPGSKLIGGGVRYGYMVLNESDEVFMESLKTGERFCLCPTVDSLKFIQYDGVILPGKNDGSELPAKKEGLLKRAYNKAYNYLTSSKKVKGVHVSDQQRGERNLAAFKELFPDISVYFLDGRPPVEYFTDVARHAKCWEKSANGGQANFVMVNQSSVDELANTVEKGGTTKISLEMAYILGLLDHMCNLWKKHYGYAFHSGFLHDQNRYSCVAKLVGLIFESLKKLNSSEQTTSSREYLQNKLFSNLEANVSFLVYQLADHKSPLFFGLIPVFHLPHSKSSNAFAKTTVDLNFEIPGWWGLTTDDLKRKTESFNYLNEWNPYQYLEYYSCLFRLDYRLPNTIMAFISREQSLAVLGAYAKMLKNSSSRNATRYGIVEGSDGQATYSNEHGVPDEQAVQNSPEAPVSYSDSDYKFEETERPANAMEDRIVRSKVLLTHHNEAEIEDSSQIEESRDDDVLHIPFHVLLANSIHFLEESISRSNYFMERSESNKARVSLLKEILEYDVSRFSDEEIVMSYHFSKRLWKSAVRCMSDIMTLVVDVLQMLDILQQRLPACFPESRVDQTVFGLADSVVIFYALDTDKCSRLQSQELLTWDALLSILDHRETEDPWKAAFSTAFKKRVRNAKNNTYVPTKFFELYTDGTTVITNSLVEETIGEEALNSFEQLLMQPRNSWGHDVEEAKLIRMGAILCNKFLEKFPKSQTVTDIIEFVVSWGPFIQFMRLASDTMNTGTFTMTVACTDGVAVCKRVVNDFCRSVVDGSLTVDQYNKLKKHFVKLGEIFRWLNGDEEAEMFLVACESLKPNHLKFKQNLNCLSALQSLPRTHSCFDCLKVLSNKLTPAQYADVPVLTAFGYGEVGTIHPYFCVDIRVFEQLSRASSLCKSSMFRDLWKETVARVEKDGVSISTIEDVLTHVWVQTVEQANSEVSELDDGTMSLGRGQLLRKGCQGVTGGLAGQIQLISGRPASPKTIGNINQVVAFTELRQYKDAAKVLKRVFSMLKVENDDKLEVILSTEAQSSQPISSFDVEQLHQLKELLDITPEKTDCLKALLDSQKLVDWVNINLGGGVTEVKVFIVLATTASDEGDLTMEKLSALDSALTGYAPLLFDLPKRCKPSDFYKCCQDVWKTLKSNHNLAGHLRDSNQEMEWIESILNHYGSVETKSMDQAARILECGVFEVGNLGQRLADVKDLNNLMKLRVELKGRGQTERSEHPELEPMEEGEDTSVSSPLSPAEVPTSRDVADDSEQKFRHYSYEQLCELRSTLMLVAGMKVDKEDHTVEKFVRIFEEVTNLATTYQKLCLGGSILFSRWKATFYCDRSRTIQTEVDFDMATSILQGERQDDTELSAERDAPVLAEVRAMRKFVEKCEMEWGVKLEQMREQFPELGFYTNEQIVHLRRLFPSVASAGDQKEANKIYGLLAMLRPGCTEADIRDAFEMINTKEDTVDTRADTPESSAAASVNEEPEAQEFMDDIEADPMREVKTSEESVYVKELESRGFDRKLAVRALVHCRPLIDIEEGVIICMKHTFESSSSEGSSDYDSDDMSVIEDDQSKSSRLQSDNSNSGSEAESGSIVSDCSQSFDKLGDLEEKVTIRAGSGKDESGSDEDRDSSDEDTESDGSNSGSSGDDTSEDESADSSADGDSSVDSSADSDSSSEEERKSGSDHSDTVKEQDDADADLITHDEERAALVDAKHGGSDVSMSLHGTPEMAADKEEITTEETNNMPENKGYHGESAEGEGTLDADDEGSQDGEDADDEDEYTDVSLESDVDIYADMPPLEGEEDMRRSPPPRRRKRRLRVKQSSKKVVPVVREYVDHDGATNHRNLLTALVETMNEDKGLYGKLDDLWENYIGSDGGVIHGDYLTLSQLGHVLRHLKPNSTSRRYRSLVGGLKKGLPNLIVMTADDILQAVLTVYAGDQHSPFPTRNEVLLCTEETSLNEVRLFLCRVFSTPGTIYSLVNGENLTYDISRSFEKELLSKNIGAKDYCLVIFCSQEDEDRCHLVTALNRFRLKNFPLTQFKDLLPYVKQRLAGQRDGIFPSSVNIGGCCATVVSSDRAGSGKTLYIKRLAERLVNEEIVPDDMVTSCHVTLPVQSRVANQYVLAESLLKYAASPDDYRPRLYHINVAHEVREGLDVFLFNLLILGSVCDREGYVWTLNQRDLYMIEVLPLTFLRKDKEKSIQTHRSLELLPTVTCLSPTECQQSYQDDTPSVPSVITMDEVELNSDAWQITYRYLFRYTQRQSFDDLCSEAPKLDSLAEAPECLTMMLRHCGLVDPSWAELSHFVHFLSHQLQSCAKSAFCMPIFSADLPGFVSFVVEFMLQMSKDFATRSIKMAEETPGFPQKFFPARSNDLIVEEEEEPAEGQEHGEDDHGEQQIERMQLKRRWESSAHPYLLFNQDGVSMTFLGFVVNRQGDIVDPSTNAILQRSAVPPQLYQGLQSNRVDLNERFHTHPRSVQIEKLCTVLGNQAPHDPDSTYELTLDNVKKILAIAMRFRCGIPVVVMGETGSGKTRLIKFLCQLQKPAGVDDIENMILMKVHGGTEREHVVKQVLRAQKMAQENRKRFPHMDTVLFFDEANTSDVIGLIKEVMCDGTLEGQKLEEGSGLCLIAACNPYRKHSDAMISTLEKAGLGYHIRADKTEDKFGEIPMRQLVYRVKPLPRSMIPLVWDFGQLDSQVEELYIGQMIQRKINEGHIPQHCKPHITNILAQAQGFMRKLEDECSFVSLRDVERFLTVFIWFWNHRDTVVREVDNYRQEQAAKVQRDGAEEPDSDDDYDEDGDDTTNSAQRPQALPQPMDDMPRCVILALGVCYHASLNNTTRPEFRNCLAPHLQEFCPQRVVTEHTIAEIMDNFQVALIDMLRGAGFIPENIACNQALMENLLMMVICIELRIPLFLVGKPGSSKSLAKSIVGFAMQGETSKIPLFKHLKKVQMESFQCSPLATPQGIVGTFSMCARWQKKKDLDKFVAVVVLDEVGLAEDSKLMPLKALHPLLEDGCETSEEKPEPYKKVAFIGISNWALDPAKMNRGLLVQRGVPDRDELVESARGICQFDLEVQEDLKDLMPLLADAYLKCFNEAVEEKGEFFGLRDFYALVKMVGQFSVDNKKMMTTTRPSPLQLEHAIRRNFGGLESTDTYSSFKECLDNGGWLVDATSRNDENLKDGNSETVPVNPIGLVDASLTGRFTKKGESRYLLLLTENYAALDVLTRQIDSLQNPKIIFGSRFAKDLEYAQVCRNINEVKRCMEVGSTVILLNLESLYESLYDTLNQYYITYRDKRFVDLGLGTQRVKCLVHDDFRLIVVADKKTVYEKFPIPLINRLEKHCVSMETLLTSQQQENAKAVQTWAEEFIAPRVNRSRKVQSQSNSTPVDLSGVFIGYSSDTAAAVVFRICQQDKFRNSNLNDFLRADVVAQCKKMLLACATPDGVMRLKKGTGIDREEANTSAKTYADMNLNSMESYLIKRFGVLGTRVTRQSPQRAFFIQLTTHSKLMTSQQTVELNHALSQKMAEKGLDVEIEDPLNLQVIETKDHFSRIMRRFFTPADATEDCVTLHRIAVIQCEVAGVRDEELVACARWVIDEERKKASEVVNHLGRAGRTSRPSSFPGRDSPRLANRHIILVLQLGRTKNNKFVGFQCGRWVCAHIDELCQPEHAAVNTQALVSVNASLSTVIEDGLMKDSTAMPAANTDVMLHLSHMNRSAEEPMDNVSTDWPMEKQPCSIMGEVLAQGITAGEPMDASEPLLSPVSHKESVVQPHFDGTGSFSLDTDVDMYIGRNEGMSNRGADSSGHDSEEKTSEKPVDVYCLQYNCIQNAVRLLTTHNGSHVVGEDTINSRGLTQIQILTESLTPSVEDNLPGKSALSRALADHVSNVIKQREEKRGGASVATRYIEDAGEYSKVNAEGTLRRSLEKTVENTYSAVMAAILSVVDANRNLDLVMRVEQNPARFNLWIKMLKANEDISYSRLCVKGGGEELKIFPIRFLSADGNDLPKCSPKFPFSWQLKKIIQTVLDRVDNDYDDERDDQDEMSSALSIMGDNSMVVALTECGISPSKLEKWYLHDFLLMTVCSSKQHVDVLAVVFRALMREINGGAGDILPKLLRIHIEYTQWETRLRSVHKFLLKFEELGTNVDLNKVRESCIPEVVVEPVLLQSLLSSLLPSDDELTEAAHHWSEKVEAEIAFVSEVLDPSAWSQIRYGNSAHRLLDQCVKSWRKIMTIQLFVKHVVLASDSDPTLSKTDAIKFSKMLGERPDFKTFKSYHMVETFLLVTNQRILLHIFGIEKGRCPKCRQELSELGSLPCGHYVCSECFNSLSVETAPKCVRCKKPVPKGYRPDPDNVRERERMARYRVYRDSCNSFFMVFVTTLVFGGSTPPENEVVGSLLKRVTDSVGKAKKGGGARGGQVVTRKLALFKGPVDPSPVVRSLLLKLLLGQKNSNETQMHEHLDQFFIHAKGAVPDNIKELCVMIIHCIEDAKEGRQVYSETDRNSMKKWRQACELSIHAMHAALSDIFYTAEGEGGNPLSVQTLQLIADTRWAISEVVGVVHNLLVKHTNSTTNAAEGSSAETECPLPREVFAVVNAVNELYRLLDDRSERIQKEWEGLRVYAAAETYHHLGQAALLTLLGDRRLSFIIPEAIRQNVREKSGSLHDPFVVSAVLGREEAADAVDETYRVRRAALSDLIGKNGTLSKEAIPEFLIGLDEEIGCRKLLLAVYRVVTRSCLFEVSNVKAETRDNLEKILLHAQGCRGQLYEQMVRSFLHNTLPRSMILVRGRTSLDNQSLGQLIAHTWVMFGTDTAARNRGLISPLSEMVTAPVNLMGQYFPTMPQQEFDKIKTALKGRPYMCPNGHVYTIERCGRPAERGRCHVCGAVTGGINHRAEAGNREVSLTETLSKTGHCLGAAHTLSKKPKQTVSDRDESLPAAGEAIVRTLLHLTMYAGSITHADAVYALIPGPLLEGKPTDQFLWEHLRLDVQILSLVLNRNPGDVCLFVHQLLEFMFSETGRELSGTGTKYSWMTIDGVNKWTRDFYRSLIQAPQRAAGIVIDSARTVAADDSADSDLSAYLSQGTTKLSQPANQTTPLCWKDSWRCSRRVTVDAFSARTDTAQTVVTNLILGGRFGGREAGQALYKLPDIVRLVKEIGAIYTRRLDMDTGKRSLRWLCKENGDHMTSLVESFLGTWNLVRGGVADFEFQFERGKLKLASDKDLLSLCQKTLTLDTAPVGMLLPNRKGKGLCSVALALYLVEAQNWILEEYRKSKDDITPLPSVSLDTVAVSHLVAVNAEEDILPIILSHRNYLVEGKEAGNGRAEDGGVERNTEEFDFESLERTITEAFLRSKRIVAINPRYPLPRFNYAEEMRNTKTLANLTDQEPLRPDEAGRIVAEYRSSVEDVALLSDTLSRLDTTVGLMPSVKYDPEQNLPQFMNEKLRLMRNVYSSTSMLSVTAEKHCQLKHLRSLWLLLAMERSQLLFERKKEDPFEGLLHRSFCEPMSDTQKAAVSTELRRVNTGPLRLFLYEFILLRFANSEIKPGEEADEKNYKLSDYIEYQDDMDLGQINSQLPGLMRKVSALSGPPGDEVRVSQTASLWRHLASLQIEER